MKLNSLSIFSTIFAVLLSTNLHHIFNIKLFLLTDIFSLISLLIIPGILLLLIFKLKLNSFWESASFIVGLSLFFVMIVGLCINLVLPKFGVHNPLSLYPTLISFDVILGILFVVAYIRNKSIAIRIPPIFKNKHTFAFTICAFAFPILAILGAISLNNEGTNLFTMIMLGGIALYVLLLTIFRNRVSQSIFPTSLYLIGLSLLLMTSLRSWYIIGHDIQTEYYVFQLTKLHHLWSIDWYKDAYNACLSITILPTIISSFTHFNDMYIYKIIFQMLFAITPVIIYLFLRKYTTNILAFIATFYFLAFPTFFNDMPMLNRQEIGFIFFGLVLLVTFTFSLPKYVKNIFFIIFVFGLVISHYSTNYVLLLLFIFVYLAYKLSNIKKVQTIETKLLKIVHIVPNYNDSKKSLITGFMILSLIGITFFWNNQFTPTGSHVKDVIGKTLHGIFIHSMNENKSGDLAYSLFFSHKKADPQKLLDDYIAKNINAANDKNEGNFYAKKDYEKYKIAPLSQETISLTPIGTLLTSLNVPVFSINALARQISALFMQIAVLFGILSLYLFYKTRKIDKEYFLLCVGGVLMLGLMIILPSISMEYGLLRMFQQLLVVFALPIVIVTLLVTKFLSESKQLLVVAGIAMFFLLTLTGFYQTLTGGYYGQMNLNNQGIYYDSYYVKRQDYVSAQWLAANRDKDYPVQADNSGLDKLSTFGGISGLKEIFPPIIRKNAYVYITSTNIKNNAIVIIELNTLLFNSPVHFLSDNKNLLYNNGFSQIYK